MIAWTIVASAQDVVVLNKLRASVVQIYSLGDAFFVVGRYDVLSLYQFAISDFVVFGSPARRKLRRLVLAKSLKAASCHILF